MAQVTGNKPLVPLIDPLTAELVLPVVDELVAVVDPDVALVPVVDPDVVLVVPVVDPDVALVPVVDPDVVLVPVVDPESWST